MLWGKCGCGPVRRQRPEFDSLIYLTCRTHCCPSELQTLRNYRSKTLTVKVVGKSPAALAALDAHGWLPVAVVADAPIAAIMGWDARVLCAAFKGGIMARVEYSPDRAAIRVPELHKVRGLPVCATVGSSGVARYPLCWCWV